MIKDKMQMQMFRAAKTKIMHYVSNTGIWTGFASHFLSIQTTTKSPMKATAKFKCPPFLSYLQNRTSILYGNHEEPVSGFAAHRDGWKSEPQNQFVFPDPFDCNSLRRFIRFSIDFRRPTRGVHLYSSSCDKLSR